MFQNTWVLKKYTENFGNLTCLVDIQKAYFTIFSIFMYVYKFSNRKCFKLAHELKKANSHMIPKGDRVCRNLNKAIEWGQDIV